VPIDFAVEKARIDRNDSATGDHAMMRRNMATHTVNNELDSLKSDMSKLRSDLAGLAEALIKAGKHEAGAAKERLEEEVHTRLDSLREKAGDAREAGANALKSIESHIEERPFVSMLVAFAVGLVFGKFLDRR
jgi:ElaB/YqjD/DUF883 family membrane-anchored ribosome-binding protein